MGITKIEWVATLNSDGSKTPGYSFNPWRGCTKVSEGCKYCYAEVLSKRNPKVLGMWGPQGTRVMASESYWRQPLKWDAQAKAAGERHRVFCASLADVFEGPETCSAEAYEVIRRARVRLFNLIAETPHLDWLLLTKRPENVISMIWETCAYSGAHTPGGQMAHAWKLGKPPKNVWMGTSVEDQKAADTRVQALIKIPAEIHFLSCEPLLGHVTLFYEQETGCGVLRGPGVAVSGGMSVSTPDSPPEGYDDSYPGIDWVIAGGESGPHARPMHPDWARSLRDQCKLANVPFHFKQNGEFVSVSEVEGRGVHYTFPDGATVRCTGKELAGRTLDGEIHDALPEAR